MHEDIAAVLRGEREWCVVTADCLEVLPTLPEGCVDVCIADPPYGARRPSARRSANERFDEVVGNDRIALGWLSDVAGCTKDGGCAYVFTCWDTMAEWKAAMGLCGLRVRSCVIWDKVIHGLGDLETCWAPQHEMILFGAKGRHMLQGARPKDILRCQRVDAKDLLHPYQKPVGLLFRLVEASASLGDVVLDPFAGSGSTGVACLRTGRRFIGIEIDPDYCAIARRRLAAAEADQRDSLFPARDPGPQQRTFADLDLQEEA